MDKGKTLDFRFEQIDALNAKIMNLKMILKTLNDRLRRAQEEENTELVEELKYKIEMQKRQIEDNIVIIKKINEEIRNNWRQPEKDVKTTEETSEEKQIVETSEIRWYNFIQRFKRWRDNRNQKLLGEGQVTKMERKNKPNPLKQSIQYKGGPSNDSSLNIPKMTSVQQGKESSEQTHEGTDETDLTL